MVEGDVGDERDERRQQLRDECGANGDPDREERDESCAPVNGRYVGRCGELWKKCLLFGEAR